MSDHLVPLAMQCPHCGAALTPQAGQRECRCGYCQAEVPLPAPGGPVYRAPPPPSALSTAIGRNDVERLRALLEAGADPNATVERYGLAKSLLFRAIEEAIAHESSEAVLLLLEYGADPNMTLGPANMPMMHAAAIAGVAEIATGLLKYGASPDVRDGWGKTPLHNANSPAVVEILVRAGADVNARDHKGRTPLQSAKEWRNKPVIEALKRCGARGGIFW